MADVDVYQTHTVEVKKTKKVKKTSKRRESQDGNVQITEVEEIQTIENSQNGVDQGYVSFIWCNFFLKFSIVIKKTSLTFTTLSLPKISISYKKINTRAKLNDTVPQQTYSIQGTFLHSVLQLNA